MEPGIPKNEGNTSGAEDVKTDGLVMVPRDEHLHQSGLMGYSQETGDRTGDGNLGTG